MIKEYERPVIEVVGMNMTNPINDSENQQQEGIEPFYE